MFYFLVVDFFYSTHYIINRHQKSLFRQYVIFFTLTKTLCHIKVKKLVQFVLIFGMVSILMCNWYNIKIKFKMRYNTIHAKDFGKFVSPVLKTLANEVQKEMANHKDFPFTNPLTNIVSLENSIEIHLAVPGLSKEDLIITLDKSQLTVTAQKNIEDAHFKQREFKFGTFKKVFNLPDTVNKEKISATTVNGILKITLEKNPEAIKKTISVL